MTTYVFDPSTEEDLLALELHRRQSRNILGEFDDISFRIKDY